MARVSPFTSKASAGRPTTIENAVPVWCWHSVQCHTAVATGSASHEYVMLPHMQ